ncbi:serine dehydratase subunit alpha family protein [Aliagarivorans marinus]|uniref:L-cysteine desulfidase family protein n=1 Tax=Aliagarivorans marinus TaxID=561965 RepID=UPI0004048F81|nr:L-serine ammonia-lyase, iron-sulfur-dependent, subunit alpha [Aliagarivorans marinus]
MAQLHPYTQLINQRVKPATGCTEPLTAALVAAKAKRYASTHPASVHLEVSHNLYKNAKGVVVPGTGRCGLEIATALGWCCGDADAGLEVLHGINDAALEQAAELVESDWVTISLVESDDPLYTRLVVKADKPVEVVISGSHCRFSSVKVAGELLHSALDETSQAERAASDISISQIVAYASTVEVAELDALRQAATLNLKLADAGLTGHYGLSVGRSLQAQVDSGLLADDVLNRAVRLTAAASDARMGGAPLAAMSNSGSGNQGIAATMPVLAYAQIVNVEQAKLLRALAISHLCAIYIKSFQDKLSALCAGTTAAMGSAAALCWLMGGSNQQIEQAIKLMIGDVSGIFCDGAKPGCALKVSTGASAAVKAAIMALGGSQIGAEQGIVEDCVDESIQRLGELSRDAMRYSDKAIIALMAQK